MKTELFYLALVTAFTGVLWIPYIIDRATVRGLMDAVGYPENPKPQSPWAQRLMKAHANAVEKVAKADPEDRAKAVAKAEGKIADANLKADKKFIKADEKLLKTQVDAAADKATAAANCGNR